MSEKARKKKSYIHFNEKNIKNPKLFSGLVFKISSQFKEVMTWNALVRKKDIWFNVNEKHRFWASFDKKCGLMITTNMARTTREIALKVIQVALNPNNGWWSICWAMVEKELKETWKWFVQALKEDLAIVNEEQYVIMSDKQKGWRVHCMSCYQELNTGIVFNIFIGISRGNMVVRF
ncbi:hypothetical protein LIER_41236 [Lithospermum erythrorhizon]|uniref:MULE transposase domain-containing protein n=1 Tax=Lithospermum erythrorhizon TaxID=34254 RepID=A0AAV3RAB5_LITER